MSFLYFIPTLEAREVCEILPRQKTASLLLVSFDNNDNALADSFTDLVQNAGNKYSKCFEGYDKSVLLKKRWNGSKRPTVHITTNLKNAFFEQIKRLSADGYLIDIFIFTHGYSSGTISTDFGNISKNDILDRLGSGCHRIRLVYQMNCYGSKLNSTFVSVGAEVAVGARYVNFYPNQFNKFMDEWNRGASVRNALTASNTTSSRTAAQTYIVAHSNTKFNFRKCIPGSSVLGTRPCAASYFDANWGLKGAKFNTSKSGKDNMNISSFMLHSGNRNITKNIKTHTRCQVNDNDDDDDGTITIDPPAAPRTILNTNGTVLSARRAKKTSSYSNKSRAQIIVTKLDGKARTTVSVYQRTASGSEKFLKSTEYSNGKGGGTKTINVSGVKGKKIVVYLRNHSVTNTFKYRLRVKEVN